MKSTCLLFPLLLWMGSCTPQTSPNAMKPSAINLDSLEQAAVERYHQNPQTAIPLFVQLGHASEGAGNTAKTATAYLNLAGIYDEVLDRPDSALYFSEKSIEAARLGQDTLQQANVLKYIGLLKGKLGRAAAGKSDIQAAIALFQAKGFLPGVAVSEFDLAQVLFQEKDYAGSRQLLEKATQFWRDQGVSDRVFTNNVFAIDLYRALNDQAELDRVIRENDALKPQISNEFIRKEYEKKKG